MAMRKMKYLSINVDIDQDDAFSEMTTEDLAAELAGRGVSGHRDAVATAIAHIRRGDTLDAITTLEREFWPKWASVDDSEAALRRAVGANDNAVAVAAASVEAALSSAVAN